jgi:hypothetical protein
MIVLDTNVISEIARPAPSDVVRRWFRFRSFEAIYTTAVNEAEVRAGLERMVQGKRRQELEAATDRFFSKLLANHVLPFDSAASKHFATLAVRHERNGRSVAQHDVQIAAIVRSRSAALVTRNVTDFEDCDIEIIDPWAT